MFLEEMAFILLTVAIVQAQSARVLSRFSSVFKIGFQFGFETLASLSLVAVASQPTCHIISASFILPWYSNQK